LGKKISPLGNKRKIKFQSATHTPDFYEKKKTPKSLDFAQKMPEITIIRQKVYSHIWPNCF
jgi:hypothetical protein